MNTLRCTVTHLILLTVPQVVRAKTIQGVLSTQLAKETFGQYITGFYFSGTGLVRHSVNCTMPASPRLHFYDEMTWLDVKDQDCDFKLAKADYIYRLNTSRGNDTFSEISSPVVYHIVYVDDYTCEANRPMSPLEQYNNILYNIQLFNADAFGTFTNHFSSEEIGLKTFYQVITLLYFIIACICFPHLIQTVNQPGPMNSVIRLLSVALVLQAVTSLIMAVHLYWYAKDGIGSQIAEIVSELLDLVSQFIMLYMLLSLSLGWTLGGTYRPTQFDSFKRRPAVQVVGGLAVLQGVLFLLELYQEHDHRMYHAHRSLAGQFLALLRIVLAALLAGNLYSTVAAERSAMKKDFYFSFAKSCMLWFLCYPVVVVISWICPDHLRYKMITVFVILCQSLAVVLLYKLFLSRSLFWEVSALGTLPILRIDSKKKMDG